jgi:hypothetical protein
MTTEEVDQVANDFLDGEIVDLASDWLGNTVSIDFYLAPSPLTSMNRSFKSYLKNVLPDPVSPCWSGLHLALP